MMAPAVAAVAALEVVVVQALDLDLAVAVAAAAALEVEVVQALDLDLVLAVVAAAALEVEVVALNNALEFLSRPSLQNVA